MVRFLLKGVLRDKIRSLLSLSVILLGVMFAVLMVGLMAGIFNDFIRANAMLETGHVKIMTRSYTIEGTTTTDPAFGLEAVWINPEQREHAQTLGYTVVDAATVVATHMSQLLTNNAAQLLGHEEVQNLL